jgi:hypothetical protein
VIIEMSDARHNAMRSWVEQEFALDGVLAVGGGHADGSVFAAQASGEFVMAHNDEIWKSLGAALQKLQTHSLPTGEMLWSFEESMLCTLQRDDGAWLGVFTSKLLPDESALTLRSALDAFKQKDFNVTA